MTTKKISSNTQNPLQDFNPYFFAIEKWAIEKWYIPIFLPFVIAKLIALPLYFAHEPDTILNEANDVIYLSVAIVLTLVVLLYAAWVRQIPGVFLKMKNQLIRPRLQNGVTKTYDQFLKEYLKALHSRVRFLLLLLFLITLFIILVNMLYNPINPVARNIRSITL
ncbi:MAG: hypothetical protein HY258_03960, partial [Chloroflexi bacterium]|nr:hypothetical protein [Chloroflexota bacterium]